MDAPHDLAIVGAGAAGLAAAVFAGEEALRQGRGLRVLALDGASPIGRKILISGGGRCNVTHTRVGPDDFNGPRTLVRNIWTRSSARSAAARCG